MNEPVKFEVHIALPVPEIIGGTLKLWAVPEYAHAPFSPKFQWAFDRMAHVKSIALPVSEIIVVDTSKFWAVPGYAVQGHPRTLILVPIKSAYATTY